MHEFAKLIVVRYYVTRIMSEIIPPPLQKKQEKHMESRIGSFYIYTLQKSNATRVRSIIFLLFLILLIKLDIPGKPVYLPFD